jgi:hypothetical protein
MRMAVLPLPKRKNGPRAEIDLARLPVLAAAFLIAFFGLIAGVPRNADLAVSARPIDDRTDRSPAVSKRDPIRAVTIAERKDGASGHVASDDGLPPPAFFVLATHHYAAALALEYRSAAIERHTRPGALPRAPPLAA